MHSRVVFMSQIVRSIFMPVAGQPRSCVEAARHFFACRGCWRCPVKQVPIGLKRIVGIVAPLGDELVGVRPVVVELHHRGDHPVGGRLLALGHHLVHRGCVGDRLGDDVQFDAELFGGVRHGLACLACSLLKSKAKPGQPTCAVSLGRRKTTRTRGLAAAAGVSAASAELCPNRPDWVARADSPTVVMKSRRSIDRQQPQTPE